MMHAFYESFSCYNKIEKKNNFLYIFSKHNRLSLAVCLQLLFLTRNLSVLQFFLNCNYDKSFKFKITCSFYSPCSITYFHYLKCLGEDMFVLVAFETIFIQILLIMVVVVVTWVVRMNPGTKKTPTYTYLQSGFNNSMIMSKT